MAYDEAQRNDVVGKKETKTKATKKETTKKQSFKSRTKKVTREPKRKLTTLLDEPIDKEADKVA